MLSRRRLLLTPLASFAGLAPAEQAHAHPAVWVSGEVPPFVWRGRAGPEGYAHALWLKVMKQAGRDAELRFCPLARALRMVDTGEAEAVLTVARTPERETRYRWLFPVGSFRVSVFTPAQGPAPPDDIAALRSRRVAAVRASATRELLASAGVNGVTEGKDYAEVFALLQRGFVESIVGPESVLRRQLAAQGASPEGVRITPLDRGREMYAAAGSSLSIEQHERLLKAYQQLVDQGVVAELRRKHPEAFLES